jgi:biopolymer transport protein ExbD
MSDINTTPLVDVMLVLLIIFLITVPVVIQTVPVNLPKVQFEPTTTKPENVNLSVGRRPGGGCEVYWGLTRSIRRSCSTGRSRSSKDEIKRGRAASRTSPRRPCRKRISAATSTRPTCIGGAVFTMQRAGFARVGFISEPPPRRRRNPPLKHSFFRS